VRRSIDLIEPLLSHEECKRSSWISWKAHVRLATFCLRFSYDSITDGDHLDRLVKDFDAKFHRAYPASYRKPKHHRTKHMRKHADTHGPFRNYACLSGGSPFIAAAVACNEHLIADCM
jgi:hypothetical protein